MGSSLLLLFATACTEPAAPNNAASLETGAAQQTPLAVAGPTLQVHTLGSLGHGPGHESAAFAINTSNRMVGVSEIDSISEHAFVTAENNALIDLGTLPGGRNSKALAINSRGQIVGSSDTGDTIEVDIAVLWDNGRIIRLGTLRNGANSTAYGINDAGQIVGASDIDPHTGIEHAFLWEGGVMRDLGTLGGSNSSAFAINNRGEIVGSSELPGDSVEHAFLWRHGVMTDLGTLGGSSSKALGINEFSQIVGQSEIAGNAQEHAFVRLGHTMTDIGPAGYNSTATGISNTARVVGWTETIPGPVAVGALQTSGFGPRSSLVSAAGNFRRLGAFHAGKVRGLTKSAIFVPTEGSEQTFIWSPHGGFSWQPNLFGPDGEGWGINRDGTIIVGNSDAVDEQKAAFWR